MNPILNAYITKINQAIADLDEGLERADGQLANEQAARQQLLNKYWSQGKALAVLKENEQAYAKVQEKNEALQRVHEEMKARLKKVLAVTKALGDEFNA